MEHLPTKTPLYAIRPSIVLFLMRLCTAEIGLELLYLAWVWQIDHLDYSAGARADLHAASSTVLFAVTALQVLLFFVLSSRWYFEYYVIMPAEILHRRGIFARDEQLYPYENIQTLTVHQSLLGRMLNYGTVRIYIPTLGQELRFDEIPSPEQFIEAVERAMPTDQDAKFLISK